MSGYHKGTPAYSLPDAGRRSPRLSGATMPRELQEDVRTEAARRGLTFSAALAEAAREWVARHKAPPEPPEE